MTAGFIDRQPRVAQVGKLRLAFVVTHPIQYYVPLYRRLSANPELEVRVFFTCHDGTRAVWDSGFRRPVAWDIPLLDGYESVAVLNKARHPSTDRFWGVRTPTLRDRVLSWRPDAVHLTGYKYAGHLRLLRSLHARQIPVLFRGDSHLLSPRPGWKSWFKRQLLPWIFSYPDAFLYVGQHNRAYYEAFGVPAAKLWFCPHSTEIERFAEPHEQLEEEAKRWRQELGLGPDQIVLLFAGKFESKKEPVALMKAVASCPEKRFVLVMLGDGALGDEVRTLAAENPQRFRVLPFQNQAKMPVAYRLGDLLVLPSSHDETWGLAVNESFACSRPALVSNQVGCAPELIRPGFTGDVFRSGDWANFRDKLAALISNRERLLWMRSNARAVSDEFSIAATEKALLSALGCVVRRNARMSEA